MSQNYFLFSELFNYSKAARHSFLHSSLVALQTGNCSSYSAPTAGRPSWYRKGPAVSLSSQGIYYLPVQIWGCVWAQQERQWNSLLSFSPTPGWYSPQMLQWQRKKEKKARCRALGRRGLYLVKGLQHCSSTAPHRGLLRRNALSSAAGKAGKSQ